MPNFFAIDINTKVLQSETSNTNTEDYNALGANTGTMQIADKLYFGRIPGGSRVEAFTALISTAMAGSVTANIGYEPVTADEGAFAASLAFWFTAQAMSSTGRFTSVSKPVDIPQDCNIVATIAGAASGTTYDVTIITHVKFKGKK